MPSIDHHKVIEDSRTGLRQPGEVGVVGLDFPTFLVMRPHLDHLAAVDVIGMVANRENAFAIQGRPTVFEGQLRERRAAMQAVLIVVSPYLWGMKKARVLPRKPTKIAQEARKPL